MIISQFSVRLERLKAEDIELVRVQRNRKDIQAVMDFQETISPQDQITWFQGLNPISDFYFVIEYKGAKVGLIHTAKVDWDLGTGDVGLFIWEKLLWGSYVPVMASLTMLDTFFVLFTLNTFTAKVKNENRGVLKYNEALGFLSTSKQTKPGFAFMELNREQYVKASSLLRKAAEQIGSEPLQISMGEKLYNSINELGGINNQYEQLGGLKPRLTFL